MDIFKIWIDMNGKSPIHNHWLNEKSLMNRHMLSLLIVKFYVQFVQSISANNLTIHKSLIMSHMNLNELLWTKNVYSFNYLNDSKSSFNKNRQFSFTSQFTFIWITINDLWIVKLFVEVDWTNWTQNLTVHTLSHF